MIDEFFVAIQIWIAMMLTVQSVILYKLLPEIKKVSANSDSLGAVFGLGKKVDDKNNQG